MEFKNIEVYKKYLNGLSLSKLKQIYRDIDDIQDPEKAVIIYRRIKQIEPNLGMGYTDAPKYIKWQISFK